MNLPTKFVSYFISWRFLNCRSYAAGNGKLTVNEIGSDFLYLIIPAPENASMNIMQ
jgi:hypothetical protein